MAKEVLYRVCYNTSRPDKEAEYKDRAADITINNAILHDYSRRKVMYASYPGITAQKGHTVKGAYVTGLTHADISQLDSYESEGSLYHRVKVKVVLEGGNEVETETYVFGNPLELTNEEWSFEEFCENGLGWWSIDADVYCNKGADTFLGSDMEEAVEEALPKAV